jgi:nitrite reductase/ring-hydroxylating ferredoxin subunit
VTVASLAELPKNAMKVVDVFGQTIIVANTGREIVAIARACPHENSPLDKGLLRGRNIVCPLHAYIWNVHTGEPVEPADEDTLRRYPVKIDQDEGQIFVAVAAP